MTQGHGLPRTELEWPTPSDPMEMLEREWLLTNGLGGYAAGTLALCNTRRYHGLFVPSLPGGKGRTVLLNRMREELVICGQRHRIDGEETVDLGLELPGPQLLRGFRLNGLIPEWTFVAGGTTIRRSLVLVHGANIAFLIFDHLGGPDAEVRAQPFTTFRPHDRLRQTAEPAHVHFSAERIEISHDGFDLPLKLKTFAPARVPFVGVDETSPEAIYRLECSRGYPGVERLATAGYFAVPLRNHETFAIGISTEPWDVFGDLSPEQAYQLELERELKVLGRAPEASATGVGSRLTLSADQFIVEPAQRGTEAWARTSGRDPRSVIAGYHWFTDWGRDTMISLEGLTLVTGRSREASAILRTFQRYVRDGLLPNCFPEGESEGLYYTADATLWFFHAIDRYLAHSNDRDLLLDLFPTLKEIVRRHVEGTRFNIQMDRSDALLRQGTEGYPLTWMDAKVGDWVVTPRRGKAVEVNALWYNALRLMGEWSALMAVRDGWYGHLAERAKTSFNGRFWNASSSCLFDVVDGESGDDPSIRPNQVFSISLKYPVLSRDRWEPVLSAVRNDLLTPVGLRSLSPKHPDYKGRYEGDLRARDSAYHQGTVWPWLLGHFIEAFLKAGGNRAEARALLRELEHHLRENCIGQVSEIFDADAPHRPRGCVAQAWSVAELLRAWVATR